MTDKEEMALAALVQVEWIGECPGRCCIPPARSNFDTQHWHCPLCDVAYLQHQAKPAHEPDCDLGNAIAAMTA